MKRYSNLFDTLCSLENIAQAHRNARKGKRHYKEVKMVDRDPERYFSGIRELLVSGEFRTAPYVHLVRQCCGKTRDIYKLPYYPDRIVHHCIVQVAAGIWTRGLVRDTFACVPGRGIHDGMQRVKRAMKDVHGTRYCLKMDVEKFYPSIDHDVLKDLLRRKIKDDRVMALMDEIIDSHRPGVPIGNYLSQHFGNQYLSGFDHWIKEVKRCRYYFRYCDDLVILGGDKAGLHALRVEAAEYLADRLRLRVKPNWQVFETDSRGLDFLGYRFFHGYVLLRKRIVKKIKRRMRTLTRRWASMPAKTVAGSVASYKGWMQHADCYHLQNAVLDAPLRDAVGRACAAGGMKNPLRAAA